MSPEQPPPAEYALLAGGGVITVERHRIDRSGAVAVDRRGRQTDPATSSATSSLLAGFRFPREVISLAARWYLRCGLSCRDVEELLAERGIRVDHVTIYRWVRRFTPEFIEAARPGRHAPGDRWPAGEASLKVAGQWVYLYRAIDQHGQVIDVFLSARRDLAAARRFFARALRAGTVPAEALPTARPFTRGSSMNCPLGPAYRGAVRQ